MTRSRGDLGVRGGTRPIIGIDRPVASLGEHVAAGGGAALAAALRRPPRALIDEIRRSGLRGRGGAGFPTGAKLAAVRDDPCRTKYVVCNAAEGEPGTFKDRWLLRRNPYQVLEGTALAAHAVGARRAFVALKAGTPELPVLRLALGALRAEAMLGPVSVEVVTGPDDYLFGEEKAMLEVVEGGEALPRVLPPYQVGLFATAGSPNPTAMCNVETLANLPGIVRNGASWFRSFGTETAPGTMLFTLSGDVRRPGVYELQLGSPMRVLLHHHGGGAPEGRPLKAVFPGASHAILPPERFGTPLDFDALRAVGSGLGSAGFVVYDDSACIVRATLTFARFLASESCGQCPACQHGTAEIAACLERIECGNGAKADLRLLRARCQTVTGGRRCALPSGAASLAGSAVRLFPAEFEDHLGRACPRPRELPLPKLIDLDEETGRFVYAPERTVAASAAAIGA
jgi:NADH-quinone oxidoreductase subunit F